MNKVQMALLAAELTTSTHPTTTTYNADAALAAAELNDKNISQIRSSMTGAEMWENTVASEYAALTEAEKSQWLSFCAISDHNPEVGGLAQLFVVDIFGGGSTTVSNLAAARQELISKADELGLGTVKYSNVLDARGE